MSNILPHLVPFDNERIRELHVLITAARTKLASLDATFTSEKTKVDALRARLFFALRSLYEKRDEAELYLFYHLKLLEALRQKSNEAKTRATSDFERTRTESRRQYQQTATELKAKQILSPDEEMELHQLWKKLVRLYHPDRFANEPTKLQAYTNLTAAINHAKETGDLETLREIAKDPIAFVHRQGWATLNFSDSTDMAQLEKLHQALKKEIEKAQAELATLRSSPEYDLLQVLGSREVAFNDAVTKQQAALEAQISNLEKETATVLKSIDRIS